jgi:hypothetical protein
LKDAGHGLMTASHEHKLERMRLHRRRLKLGRRPVLVEVSNLKLARCPRIDDGQGVGVGQAEVAGLR